LDLFETIKLRTSIRSFADASVSDDAVRILIDAATRAPSAGNIQPWEFVVVRDPNIKSRLAEAASEQSFIEEAPVVIVVCADAEKSRSAYGSRGAELYCLQDTAAAIQNMLLASVALELGACWVGAFHEQEVKSILRVPRGIRPIAIVPIGYPAEKPRPRYKRPLEKVVHFETF